MLNVVTLSVVAPIAVKVCQRRNTLAYLPELSVRKTFTTMTQIRPSVNATAYRLRP
jgi:hypothetical protein